MLRSTELSLRRGKLLSRFLASMTLGLVAVMVAVGPDLRLARQTPGRHSTGRDDGGQSDERLYLAPRGVAVERERRTYDDTYGFTLRRPRTDPGAHDHGGTPAIRPRGPATCGRTRSGTGPR